MPLVPEIRRFALNALCGRPDLTGEALHAHLFGAGGLERAVAALAEQVQAGGKGAACYGLGYSAGGTALWRAAAGGLPLAGLCCLSSTRLRNERAIMVPTHVFFGEDDPNMPPSDWLKTVPERCTVLRGVGHGYYLHAGDAQRETALRMVEEMERVSTGPVRQAAAVERPAAGSAD
ncbi:hypothetical protein [Rhodovulum sp. MB263]|uniref:hypothetical protein n=1 Tax=Rhodovulum sp. (strain MB263) TaxID=308754 RepID=UPI0018C8B8B3|nr:hypothetical protein [Rhodovulum sp. MB263]